MAQFFLNLMDLVFRFHAAAKSTLTFFKISSQTFFAHFLVNS